MSTQGSPAKTDRTDPGPLTDSEGRKTHMRLRNRLFHRPGLGGVLVGLVFF